MFNFAMYSRAYTVYIKYSTYVDIFRCNSLDVFQVRATSNRILI